METLFTIIPLTIYELIFSIIFLSIKIIKPLKKLNKNKVEKNDYYHEELKQYSPMINGKILGKDIYDEDVIVSMILYLDEKSKDKNATYLKHEKIFNDYRKVIFSDLNRNIDSKIKNTTIKSLLLDAVEEDLRTEELIASDYKENTGYAHISNIFPLCKGIPELIIISEGLNMVSNTVNSTLANFLIYMSIISNLFWIIVYQICNKKNLVLKSYLTKKGVEYYYNMIAYKNFLKDFTILNQREIKEEKLWLSHLRAAILYDFKGKLDDDARAYYKKILKKYEYLNNEYDRISKINNMIHQVIIASMFIIFLCLDLGLDFVVFKVIMFNLIGNPFICKILISDKNPKIKNYSIDQTE